jgi:hypothetical protein
MGAHTPDRKGEVVIYTEIGWGNATFCSTEFEGEGGEFRLPIFAFGEIVSFYLRIWIGTRVLIVDSRDGMKVQRKRTGFKLLLGIVSK